MARLTVVFLDTCTTNSSWESVDQRTQQLRRWPAALLPPGTQVCVLPCPLGAAELRSSKQRGSSVAAALVRALQGCLHNQPSQLVLVGHGFGGHLLKVCVCRCRRYTHTHSILVGCWLKAPPMYFSAQEACLQLQQLAASTALPACQRQQYACALASIRGLVFYSTPHQPLPRLALPEYEYVLPDMADACQKFRLLAAQHGWQTLGVGAAVQVGVLLTHMWSTPWEAAVECVCCYCRQVSLGNAPSAGGHQHSRQQQQQQEEAGTHLQACGCGMPVMGVSLCGACRATPAAQYP